MEKSLTMLVYGSGVHSSQLGEDKKIISHRVHRDHKVKIKYLFSVFPVRSVREIYSLIHNIIAMDKRVKRLTVNRSTLVV